MIKIRGQLAKVHSDARQQMRSWLVNRFMASNGNQGTRLQTRPIKDWETLPIDQAVSAGIAAFAETGEARDMLRAFIDRPRG